MPRLVMVTLVNLRASSALKISKQRALNVVTFKEISPVGGGRVTKSSLFMVMFI